MEIPGEPPPVFPRVDFYFRFVIRRLRGFSHRGAGIGEVQLWRRTQRITTQFPNVPITGVNAEPSSQRNSCTWLSTPW